MAISKSSVKEYNIVLAIISLCTVPIAYYLFTLGFSPVYASVGKFMIYVIMQIYRLYFINKRIKFEKKAFISYLFNISVVMALLLGLIYCSDNQRIYSVFEFISQSILIELALFLTILLFGLNKEEKLFLIQFLQKRLKK